MEGLPFIHNVLSDQFRPGRVQVKCDKASASWEPLRRTSVWAALDCQTKNEAEVGERVRTCPRPCLMKEKETLRSHPDSLILDVELLQLLSSFAPKTPIFIRG
jgi:hypothetical protein